MPSINNTDGFIFALQTADKKKKIFCSIYEAQTRAIFPILYLQTRLHYGPKVSITKLQKTATDKQASND